MSAVKGGSPVRTFCGQGRSSDENGRTFSCKKFPILSSRLFWTSPNTRKILASIFFSSTEVNTDEVDSHTEDWDEVTVEILIEEEDIILKDQE